MAGSVSPIATCPFPPGRLSSGLKTQLSMSSDHVLLSSSKLSSISSGTPRELSSYSSTIDCSSSSQGRRKASAHVDDWLSSVTDAGKIESVDFWKTRSSSNYTVSSLSSQDLDALLNSQDTPNYTSAGHGSVHDEDAPHEDNCSLGSLSQPATDTVNDIPAGQLSNDVADAQKSTPNFRRFSGSVNSLFSDLDDPLDDTQPYNVTDYDEVSPRENHREKKEPLFTTACSYSKSSAKSSATRTLLTGFCGPSTDCHPMSATLSSISHVNSDLNTACTDDDDDDDDTQPYSIREPVVQTDRPVHRRHVMTLLDASLHQDLPPKSIEHLSVDGLTSQDEFSSQDDILNMLQEDDLQAQSPFKTNGSCERIMMSKNRCQFQPNWPETVEQKKEIFTRHNMAKEETVNVSENDHEYPKFTKTNEHGNDFSIASQCLSGRESLLTIVRSTKEQDRSESQKNQCVTSSQKSNLSQQSFLSNSSGHNTPPERLKGFGRVVKNWASPERKGSITKLCSTMEINSGCHGKNTHQRRPTIGISKRSVKTPTHDQVAAQMALSPGGTDNLSMRKRKSYGMRPKRL